MKFNPQRHTIHIAMIALICLIANIANSADCLAIPQDKQKAANSKTWPSWRGPNENGIANPQKIVTEFSQKKNVIFRTPLPGPAGSTPVLWNDRIFLTSSSGKDLLLMCFSTDGKKLWEEKIGKGNKVVRAGEGNSASPSPSTDGKHVWAMICDGTLVCYTMDGKKVWEKNLQKDYGKFEIQFGLTSSPLLRDGKLFVQLIHGKMNRQKGFGTIAALDAATGKEIWKFRRESDATVENKHSYASPVFFDNGKNQYLITHGADYIIGHDPTNGKELWRCGSLQRQRYNPFLRLVASPVVSDDLIIAPSAKGGPVIGIKPGGKGNITEGEFVQWRNERGTPDVPSPILTDKYVLLCGEKGVLTCLDRKTGDQFYRKRTVGHLHRASPVLVGDLLLLTSRKGVITIVKVGEEFEQIAQNDMEETITASPMVVGGRIYLRSFNALYAIGKN